MSTSEATPRFECLDGHEFVVAKLTNNRGYICLSRRSGLTSPGSTPLSSSVSPDMTWNDFCDWTGMPQDTLQKTVKAAELEAFPFMSRTDANSKPLIFQSTINYKGVDEHGRPREGSYPGCPTMEVEHFPPSGGDNISEFTLKFARQKQFYKVISLYLGARHEQLRGLVVPASLPPCCFFVMLPNNTLKFFHGVDFSRDTPAESIHTGGIIDEVTQIRVKHVQIEFHERSSTTLTVAYLEPFIWENDRWEDRYFPIADMDMKETEEKKMAIQSFKEWPDYQIPDQ